MFKPCRGAMSTLRPYRAGVSFGHAGAINIASLTGRNGNVLKAGYGRRFIMKRTIRLIAFTLCAAAAAASYFLPRVAAQQPTSKPVDFNREVRPILSDNCFACHGPDDKQRMARLRFDTREGAFAKPGVIIPGDAQNSKLIKRITSNDPGFLIPPVDSGHRLTEQQIAT